MGLPIGCDVCYTNHAEADQDDMDTLLTLLCAAGLTFLIGVPGADDIMLNYQSTSFHDALYARRLLGLKHARSSPTGWRRCRLSIRTARCGSPTPAIRCFPSCRKEPPYEPSRCLEPAA